MENPLKKHYKTTPRDFFLWFAVMAALYISAISLVVLLFKYIEIVFPDSLFGYTDPYSGAIRFSIASLIVIFPLYVFLTRLLNKDLRRHKDKLETGVRKWLIYLTLFVAGVTLVIDLITLINKFLGGDLTTQFVFKVLAVLIVIGGAFLYYFYDLRGLWNKKEKVSKFIGLGTTIFVLIVVISGFFIIGSPKEQRFLRQDQEKINDLQNIQWQIVNYWQTKETLPQELSDLEDSISGFVAPIDSQTSEQYIYEKLGRLDFKLCATFNTSGLSNNNVGAPRIAKIDVGIIGIDGIYGNWEHGEGLTCFERSIDEELYPVRR